MAQLKARPYDSSAAYRNSEEIGRPNRQRAPKDWARIDSGGTGHLAKIIFSAIRSMATPKTRSSTALVDILNHGQYD